VADVEASNDPAFGAIGRCLGDAVQQLDRATSWLLTKIERDPDAALAGATPYLRLFGLAAGGCALAKDALAAQRAGNPGSSVAIARFFATNIANAAAGLAATVIEGADALAVEPDAIG
jgi:acyl-CoA dehydrogenase